MLINIGWLSEKMLCGILKRKKYRAIRNYVEMLKEDAPGYRIYIKDGVPLNRCDNEAFAAIGVEGAATLKSDDLQKTVKEKKKNGVYVDTECSFDNEKEIFSIIAIGAEFRGGDG